MRINRVVLIGAGNLATNLGHALFRANISIVQVFSRTRQSAKQLANALHTSYTVNLNEVVNDADLYIVSIKDDALIERVSEIGAIRSDGLFVHTAGSVPSHIWQGTVARYGVFYPMQTFSKERIVDFENLPLFLEASDSTVLASLKELAKCLSHQVYEADSLQRKYLHLSAVFACNFANHMYAISAELLEKHHLPFQVMLPLIDETARKVHALSPREAQTGPAVRYDKEIIAMQEDLLKDDVELKELYTRLSQRIHKH